MKRRDFLTTTSLALAGASLKGLKLFGQAPATPPPTTPVFTELRRGVGVFTGRGGAIGYLVTGDGLLVVDSQFADTAALCIDGLKKRSSRPIDILVNTHHHGDHTGGNKTFRPLVQTIVAHANSEAWQRKVSMAANTERNQAYPDNTFTDSWKTRLGDETVSAKYHGKGHTSGDVVVTFERANVVHMGDLMFKEFHPRIDRPAGGEIANWIKALETVANGNNADTIYIFGHGKALTGGKADLLAFRDYLSAALEYTRKAMQSGTSKEDLGKTATLPGFASVVNTSPTINLGGVLTTAYEELGGK